MKEKRMFETEDGCIFESMKKALEHEKILSLINWYEDNKLYGDFDGSVIEWEDLIEWLTVNKDKVATILKVI